MNFGSIDWFIVGAYIVLAFGAGLVASRHIKGVSDFLVAGRKLRVHLAIASLVGTELGLVTVMFMAEEGFRNGLAALIIGVIWGAAYVVVGTTGIIVQRVRRLRLLTITEFFEVRFSRGVRLLAALLLVIAGTLGMGVFLKAGGVFVVRFTNIPEAYLNHTMTALVLVVLAYTVLGGMVSVVITDYVQFIVLAVSMVLATAFVFTGVGFGNLFDGAERIAEAGGKGLNPFTHPGYGWAFILYMLIFNIAGCTLWQPVAQRTLAVDNPDANKTLFRTTSMMFFGRAFFPVLWGVAAAVYFSGATVDNSLAAMPDLLARLLPTVVCGLLAAGMFAALMSTFDSYLLAWAGVIVQDLVAPCVRRPLSDRARVLLVRLFVLVIGAVMLLFGIWYQLKDSAYRYLLDACTIYYAGGLAVIVAGLYWKRATTFGAYLGFLMGAILPAGYIAEDLLSGGASRTFADLCSSNMRGFLSFLLGFAGVLIGSLIPVGAPRELVYPDRNESTEGF